MKFFINMHFMLSIGRLMLFLGECVPSPRSLPRALRAKQGIEYEGGSFLREVLLRGVCEGFALTQYSISQAISYLGNFL